MKLKRVLSAILCAALLFTGTTLPVDAAISFNGGGGNTYPGSGAGKANWAWSPGNISSRFGYRISVHYAPQQQDSAGNYLTDDNGEPIYDWSQEWQVGHTIDIRQDPMVNRDTNSIIKPSQWGLWSAWNYNEKGGAFGQQFRAGWNDGSQSYYYYGFNNDDRYIRNSDSNAYMCAIFNTDTVRNSDIVPNEAKANEIVSKI